MYPAIIRSLRTSVVLFFALVLLADVACAVEPGKTSYTAEAVCAFRSIAALDPDPKTRNPDHMAVKFVNPAFYQRFPGLGLDFEDAKIAMDQLNSGVFYYVNARTHHMDAMLKNALDDGARQVVIMGAGFDSRAYRFHDAYPNVRFFEIDLPATSADKQHRVEKLLGKRPEWVTFVPIDFNTQTLDEVLGKAGFAMDQKTFYVWEGVTYYISSEGVDSTMRFIAEKSAPGSRIVFDYILADVVLGKDYSAYGARRTVYHVAHRGEPYVFGIPPQQLEIFINLRGLALLSDLGPEQLSQRYLINSDGKLSGRISEFLRIVHAQVPSPAESQQLRRQAQIQTTRIAAEKSADMTTHTVIIPKEVQSLLDGHSRCIVDKDFAALVDYFSPHYRSRGFGRQQVVAYIQRMNRERSVPQHRIVLTRFDQKGNKAIIDGFIDYKEYRIPLMVSEIIKEADGRWRWYGNQR